MSSVSQVLIETFLHVPMWILYLQHFCSYCLGNTQKRFFCNDVSSCSNICSYWILISDWVIFIELPILHFLDCNCTRTYFCYVLRCCLFMVRWSLCNNNKKRIINHLDKNSTTVQCALKRDYYFDHSSCLLVWFLGYLDKLMWLYTKLYIGKQDLCWQW